jgi:hypothetical protein
MIRLLPQSLGRMGGVGIGSERRLIGLVGGGGGRPKTACDCDDVNNKFLRVRADSKFDHPILTKSNNETGVMRLAGGG